MRSATISLLVIVTVATVLNFANGEETCKQVMSGMTKRQMTGIAKCTKSMKFKNGKDKAAKMNCILRCVMTNEGVLSEDGLMSRETFDKFMETQVPTAMKENALKFLGACQEKHHAELVPDDEFCKSYDGLIKCFMGAVMQLC